MTEDAGYLLTDTFDDHSERSQLVVLDATDVTRGPLASVALHQRVHLRVPRHLGAP